MVALAVADAVAVCVLRYRATQKATASPRYPSIVIFP
jgi:hypothetical protein